MAIDVDDNKSPKFYLTYFEESDGLDSKSLKVIVYSKEGKNFIKSKITTWTYEHAEEAVIGFQMTYYGFYCYSFLVCLA